MAYDEHLAERIRRVLRNEADITERRMFGGLAFLRHGRMCCGIAGSDLVVRVTEAEMPGVMRQPHVRPMDFTGKPLRGFVYVRPAGLSSAAALRTWIARGLRFVDQAGASSKQPRATTRRSKTSAVRR
jgi:TfoX/Sxy family transcriptional regulator of competence genes